MYVKDRSVKLCSATTWVGEVSLSIQKVFEKIYLPHQVPLRIESLIKMQIP